MIFEMSCWETVILLKDKNTNDFLYLNKRWDTVGQPLVWFLMVQIEVLKSSDHDEHFRRKNAKEAHAFGMDMTRDFFINILRKIFL